MKKEKVFAFADNDSEEIVEETIEKEAVEEPVNEYPEEGYVIARMLAVRQEASQTSLMIRVLYKDDKINYKKFDDEWYALQDGGFVMSKFVQ